MTNADLSGCFHLKERREKLHWQLSELRAVARAPSIPRLDGMPRAPSRGTSHTEKYAIKIADMENQLDKLELEILREECRIQRFISSVPDSYMRLVLRYRYIDCLQWEDVAKRIGGDNTEGGCKVSCYRFLKETEAQKAP